MDKTASWGQTDGNTAASATNESYYVRWGFAIAGNGFQNDVPWKRKSPAPPCVGRRPGRWVVRVLFEMPTTSASDQILRASSISAIKALCESRKPSAGCPRHRRSTSHSNRWQVTVETSRLPPQLGDGRDRKHIGYRRQPVFMFQFQLAVRCLRNCKHKAET